VRDQVVEYKKVLTFRGMQSQAGARELVPPYAGCSLSYSGPGQLPGIFLSWLLFGMLGQKQALGGLASGSSLI
jgi:hypothetical protein